MASYPSNKLGAQKAIHKHFDLLEFNVADEQNIASAKKPIRETSKHCASQALQ
jgi:hypothetical protein